MGSAPTPILVSTYGSGNSADGAITRDYIDDLIAGMSSHLLIYLYAKKITPGTTAFVDRLGNTVTNATTGSTKNNSDSNFNGHASITFDNTNNPFTFAAGGIGIGTPPIAMTNSFTFMAGVRPSTSSTIQMLYGDTAGTSGSVSETVFYFDSSGDLRYAVGTSSYTNLGLLLAAGTTGVIWISFDSATNILRAGVNSTSIALQATTTYNRTGAGTSTVCTPFGFPGGGGNSGYQGFNRWALFNKAYMNGLVPSDDAAFSNLISSYAEYL